MKKKTYTLCILALLVILHNPKLYAGEFLNTFLHINLSVSYGFLEGTIFDHEHDSFSIKDYRDNNVRPNHYSYSFGAFFDIVPFPPIILGDEAHAIKIGIRGAYRFHTIVQNIDYQVTKTDEDTLRENYIVYESPMAGLVIRYTPMIKPSSIRGDYSAEGGLTFFALYGKLRDGKLYSYPIMREKDPENATLLVDIDKQTKITGYRMDFGIGGEVGICSINLGMNLTYSVINANMDNKLYETLSKKIHYSEWSFELYLGLPLEWSRTRKRY